MDKIYWFRYFDKYGEQLLKAVGFTGCKEWYGHMFVLWYNTKRRVAV